MYEPIPLAGSLFGKKRSQIKTINKFLKTINSDLDKDLDKAERAYQQLSQYYYKLMSHNSADSYIKAWFSQHPLYEIKNLLQAERQKRGLLTDDLSAKDAVKMTPLKLKLMHRINHSQHLDKIYKNFDSPDSFRSTIEAFLREEIDEPFSVASLGGQNNRVLKVTVGDETFVCRLFSVLEDEYDLGITAKQAREKLTEVAYVAQPFKMKQLNDNSGEWVFLEFSPFYPQGDLETYFDQLHEDESISIEDIQQITWHFTKQLLDFYQEIARHDVWYADLKPGNLLLTEENNIRISDAKGFILSENRKVPVKYTNTTKSYISSSVFDKDHQIDLLSVERKNLAATIYHLLTNNLPDTKQKSSSTSFEWRLKFDFNQAIFDNEQGRFFQELITDLYQRKVHSFEECADRIADFESDQSSFSSGISV